MRAGGQQVHRRLPVAHWCVALSPVSCVVVVLKVPTPQSSLCPSGTRRKEGQRLRWRVTTQEARSGAQAGTGPRGCWLARRREGAGPARAPSADEGARPRGGLPATRERLRQKACAGSGWRRPGPRRARRQREQLSESEGQPSPAPSTGERGRGGPGGSPGRPRSREAAGRPPGLAGGGSRAPLLGEPSPAVRQAQEDGERMGCACLAAAARPPKEAETGSPRTASSGACCGRVLDQSMEEEGRRGDG